MKTFKSLTMMLLAGLAFTACSSKEDVVDEGNYANQGGSVTVKIAMPTSSTTRALGGDLDDETGKSYNNGLAKEYNVASGIVALFDNAADPVCVAVQSFTGTELGFETDTNPNDRVTSKSVTLVYGNGVTPSYALVILNSAGDVAAPVIGTSYSAFLKNRTSDTNARDAKTEDGDFMMTNSVHLGDGTTNTGHENNIIDGKTGLQPINPNSITKEKVAASEYTLISVERVNAKVTIDEANMFEGQTAKYTNTTVSGKTITFENGTKKDKLTVLGWCLTAKNKTYWPVKHISEEEASNAVGKGWLDQTTFQMANHWNIPTFFRSHFGHDTNYDNAYWSTVSGISLNANGAPKGDLSDEFIYRTFKDAQSNSDWGTPLYCLENTFDVANQQQNQTTSILLAAQYVMEDLASAGDKSFYKINRTAYTPDEVPAALAAALNAANFYTDAAHTNSVKAADIVLDTDHKPALNTGVQLYKSTETSPTTLPVALTTAYGTADPVTYYKDGYCYYTVRIKHFGDSECLLYETGNVYYKYNSNAAFAGINTPDKLGRYGVLRNTWYQIKINSIAGLGRPVDDPDKPINPDPDPENPTPDDEEEYYVTAQIQILPWALRFQDADL